MERILSLDTLRMTDVARAGGKNASLGEMIGELSAAGVRVPGGFATTADAFREFLARDGLAGRIRRRLAGLDVSDVRALAAAGGEIRGWIESAPLPPDLERELRSRYAQMAAGDSDCAVAVRSSATAEDLPEASFAGQQETLLNVRGADALVDAVREVFASLYNDRAIAYRAHQGFAHDDVALSAGIQRMVRSDLGASGVAFTIDTESGFEDVVLVTAAWGLGELVVQGQVNPDEFYVHKPNLEAGRPPILRRERGSKAQKMVYGDDPAERVAVVEVPVEDRHRFSLSDDDVVELARCGGGHRAPLRPGDGHRVGAGRAWTVASGSSRPAPRRCRAGSPGSRSSVSSCASAGRCWPKAAVSGSASAPAPHGSFSMRRRWTRCATATSLSPT